MKKENKLEILLSADIHSFGLVFSEPKLKITYCDRKLEELFINDLSMIHIKFADVKRCPNKVRFAKPIYLMLL